MSNVTVGKEERRVPEGSVFHFRAYDSDQFYEQGFRACNHGEHWFAKAFPKIGRREGVRNLQIYSSGVLVGTCRCQTTPIRLLFRFCSLERLAPRVLRASARE